MTGSAPGLHVVGLLLAAGAGRRFDPSGTRLKLLEPMPHGPYAGQPIAVAAARNLAAAVDEVVAVVAPASAPAQAELHRALRAAGCTLAVNEAPQRGLGRSIAVGVAASPSAEAWLVALADMPAIPPATCRAVRLALTTAPPEVATAAPVFGGQRGHPVAFRASLRAELLAMDGDAGARSVLLRHPPQPVEAANAACRFDIDRPADLGHDPGNPQPR